MCILIIYFYSFYCYHWFLLDSSLVPPLAFRDLKPANVLMTADHEQAVLIDLGSVTSARMKLNSRKEALALQELCAETCTAPFRAPELFEPPSQGSVDEKTDVWYFLFSFGVD